MRAGRYRVNAVTGLYVSSDTTLVLEPGAVLEVIPNSSEGYSVLRLNNVERVTVRGGELIGDRYQHEGTEGQWGFGINIGGGADHLIEGVTLREMWGDGIYIGGGAQRVTVREVVCDDNRRQGMSVVSADDLLVEDCAFTHTAGHPPQAGVDLEPNPVPEDAVRRATFRRCQFNANYFGLSIYAPDRIVEDTLLEDCELANNTDSGARLVGGTNTVLRRCDAPNNGQRAYDVRYAGTYTLEDCTP